MKENEIEQADTEYGSAGQEQADQQESNIRQTDWQRDTGQGRAGSQQKYARQAQVNQQDKLTTQEEIHPVSVHVSENKEILQQMFGN